MNCVYLFLFCLNLLAPLLHARFRNRPFRYHLHHRCLRSCDPNQQNPGCPPGCDCYAEINRPARGTCFDGRFLRPPGYAPLPAIPGIVFLGR
uniref:Putative secreted protein n=1 Tax=Amblyomma triste TaxID=251400 RepID=A0A023G3T7_AMBTT